MRKKVVLVVLVQMFTTEYALVEKVSMLSFKTISTFNFHWWTLFRCNISDLFYIVLIELYLNNIFFI